MRRGLIWAFFPFGVLGLSIVMHLAFLTLAASDPSIAVEENYYEKALGWDAHRAQQARNKALGWKIHVTVDNTGLRPADPVGRVGLAVRVTDREGVSVSGAAVRLETFHHARAGRVLKAVLTPDEAGVYRTALPLRRSGYHAFRFRVERGTDVFTREIHPYLRVR